MLYYVVYKYCFECQNKNKKTNLYFSLKSMNNLSSYCGLTDSRMRASDIDLPVGCLRFFVESIVILFLSNQKQLTLVKSKHIFSLISMWKLLFNLVHVLSKIIEIRVVTIQSILQICQLLGSIYYMQYVQVVEFFNKIFPAHEFITYLDLIYTVLINVLSQGFLTRFLAPILQTCHLFVSIYRFF